MARFVFEGDIHTPHEGFTDADGERARRYADEQRDLTAGSPTCNACGGTGWIQPTRPAVKNGRIERRQAGPPRVCAVCKGKR